MILPSFKDFPRRGRLLGIDWGAARTGVAVSDESREFVFARDTIECAKCKVQSAIIDIINGERIAGVVIGLPLYADGRDSDTTCRVREFADALAGATDAPIVFIEENLTSVAAAERRQERGARRQETRDRRQGLDSISAKIILENAIAVMARNQ